LVDEVEAEQILCEDTYRADAESERELAEDHFDLAFHELESIIQGKIIAEANAQQEAMQAAAKEAEEEGMIHELKL